MDVPKLRDQLVDHEGLKMTAYRCTAGKVTIGVGRNIDPEGGKGITKEEAMHLLENDIRECTQDVMQVLTEGVWQRLSDSRQRALVDLRFNLGPTRFRTFKRMLAAIQACNFTLAADEIKGSRWYTQVQPARASKIVSMMREG